MRSHLSVTHVAKGQPAARSSTGEQKALLLGIVIALVSGPLMIWQRYGGLDGVPHWFWAKMGCIVVLAVGVVLSATSARKMRAGDAVAASRVRLGRIIASVSLFLVVLFASLAFN